MGRISAALGIVAVSLFLAALSLRGPIENATGRRTELVATIVNAMVGQFGAMGSAGIFAGLGLVLGGATLLCGRGH